MEMGKELLFDRQAQELTLVTMIQCKERLDHWQWNCKRNARFSLQSASIPTESELQHEIGTTNATTPGVCIGSSINGFAYCLPVPGSLATQQIQRIAQKPDVGVLGPLRVQRKIKCVVVH